MAKPTDVFKALSDRTRLRIVHLLFQSKKELCVCEIMDSLTGSQYNISRHLKELRIAGLIKERREGRWMLYSLKTQEDRFLKLIFQAIALLPQETFDPDMNRLKARLSLRQDGKCVIGVNSKEWKKLLVQFPART